MDLVFEAGAAADAKGKEGGIGLCAGLITDGTKTLDKIQLAEALADLASGLSSGASTDQLTISLTSLTKNLGPTLDLWAASVLEPGLRADEFERAQKRSLANLKRLKGSPEALAARVGGSIAYGENHPYAKITTETSLSAVTVADCQALHKDWIKPAGAKLYVVGDVTRAQIEELVGGRLATWKGAGKKMPAVAKGALRKGKIFLIDVPGAPQSVVSLVHLGPPRKAKDYFDTRLMSAILGGGFSSRINMNLREDKGWTYGARGGFGYTRIGSVFTAGGGIVAEHTAESILEIYKEIAGVKTAEVKDEELKREKDGTVLGLPAMFATGGAVAGAYRQLIYFGLPLDYFDSYVQKVQAVSKASVLKAGAAYLKPADVRIVVVGDAKTLEPKLTALFQDKAVGPGTIVKLDYDGKVKN